jgi:hypothetical protein
MSSPASRQLPTLSILAVAILAAWNPAANAQEAAPQTQATPAAAAGNTAQPGKTVQTLPGIKVYGLSQPTRDSLPPAYAGGQVADGASLGLRATWTS